MLQEAPAGRAPAPSPGEKLLPCGQRHQTISAEQRKPRCLPEHLLSSVLHPPLVTNTFQQGPCHPHRGQHRTATPSTTPGMTPQSEQGAALNSGLCFITSQHRSCKFRPSNSSIRFSLLEHGTPIPSTALCSEKSEF